MMTYGFVSFLYLILSKGSFHSSANRSAVLLLSAPVRADKLGVQTYVVLRHRTIRAELGITTSLSMKPTRYMSLATQDR